MRGVLAVISVLFTLMIIMVVATPAIEAVSSEVGSHDSIERVNGQSTIDNVNNVIFKWMPIMVLGMICTFAVFWYLRRERVTGRRGLG